MTVVHEILSGSNDDSQGRLCWVSCCLIVLCYSDAAPHRYTRTETSWWPTWWRTTRWHGFGRTRCLGRGLPPRGLSEAGRCPRPPIRATGEPPAPHRHHKDLGGRPSRRRRASVCPKERASGWANSAVTVLTAGTAVTVPDCDFVLAVLSWYFCDNATFFFFFVIISWYFPLPLTFVG